MTFLWVVVVLMAVGLLAEICACIGLVLFVTRASRRAAAQQREFAEGLERSARLIGELKAEVTPKFQTIQKNVSEMASLVSNRARAIKAVAQDTRRRSQLLRLRLHHEGIQTVQELREGDAAVRGGILPPIQTLRKVLRGVGIAIWILRRVA